MARPSRGTQGLRTPTTRWMTTSLTTLRRTNILSRLRVRDSTRRTFTTSTDKILWQTQATGRLSMQLGDQLIMPPCLVWFSYNKPVRRLLPYLALRYPVFPPTPQPGLFRLYASQPQIFTSRPHVVRRLRSSRAADFNDFSARRRNAQRTSASEDPRAQESSSSTSSSTSLLVPVRSPLQTVPAYHPATAVRVCIFNKPRVSASSRTADYCSARASVTSVCSRRRRSCARLQYLLLNCAIKLASSFKCFRGQKASRSSKSSQQLCAASRTIASRAPLRDESAVLRPIGHISETDDFTTMFRDDFERDFGAWFTSGADDAAHSSSNGRLEMTIEQTRAAQEDV